MTAAIRNSRSWIPPIVVAATSLIILGVLNPWLIIQSTTPAGGDMGAHVMGPALLRDSLLPSGRLTGWSNAWFGGFPLFYFYFPLPSIVIVLLDVALPYGVAFKLATVFGLVGLPPAAFYLTRALGFTRPIASITAASMAVFAFMESFSIYGGNVASTLAGEFSYSWSFSLGLVYLGLLVKALDDDRFLPKAAVVFALTALSHILTTLVLIFATLFLLPRKGAAGVVIKSWVWAFALTAWWSVPLVVRLGLSTDMAWTPLERWEEVFPFEIWLLLVPALLGMLWAVRRNGLVAPLAAATLFPLAYYPLPVLLPEWFPDVFSSGRWKLWNGRPLPYWYFGVTFFAALGLGALVMSASRRLPDRFPWWTSRAAVAAAGAVAVWLTARSELPAWAPVLVAAAFVVPIAIWFGTRTSIDGRTLLSAVAATAVLLSGLAAVSFVDGWARWNFEGYEAKQPWPEYLGLMTAIEELPEGRVHWEYSKEMDKYGTPMALMLIPFWTGPEHPSMEGLFFESSLTVPFHFLNQAETSLQPSSPVPGLRYYPADFARGIEHLELYGVRYYVTYTEEARQAATQLPDLELVAGTGPFTIFELPNPDLVAVAEYQPSVYVEPEGVSTIGTALVSSVSTEGEPETFSHFTLEWYEQLDLLDRWVVADGPEEWPRIEELDDVRQAQPLQVTGTVDDIVVTEDRISFSTTAVGVPHLVKVSYFPNWQATGAIGPYRAAPSLMVVIPTEEEVVLEFGNTWVEWLGLVLTLAGLGLLFWEWRRRRGPMSAPEPEAPEEPQRVEAQVPHHLGA